MNNLGCQRGPIESQPWRTSLPGPTTAPTAAKLKTVPVPSRSDEATGPRSIGAPFAAPAVTNGPARVAGREVSLGTRETTEEHECR